MKSLPLREWKYLTLVRNKKLDLICLPNIIMPNIDRFKNKRIISWLTGWRELDIPNEYISDCLVQSEAAETPSFLLFVALIISGAHHRRSLLTTSESSLDNWNNPKSEMQTLAPSSLTHMFSARRHPQMTGDTHECKCCIPDAAWEMSLERRPATVWRVDAYLYRTAMVPRSRRRNAEDKRAHSDW